MTPPPSLATSPPVAANSFAALRAKSMAKASPLERFINPTASTLLDNTAMLELSCGNGDRIAEMLHKRPGSIICGVEPRPAEFAMASAKNRHAIETSRCRITNSSLNNLAFSDSMFSVAYSALEMHTWDDFAHVILKEIRRVVRPGGVLVLGMRVKGTTWLTCNVGEDRQACDKLVTCLQEHGWRVTMAELVACASVSDEFWVRAEG
jgi:ubiquinone/menaquinone biosynthesis C-methylase UbiE